MFCNIVRSLPNVFKFTFSSAFLAIVLLPGAHAQSPSPSPIPNPSQPPPATPSDPGPSTAPGAPSTAGDAPSAHMMRTWRQLTYMCADNAKVVVNVHATSARVVFKGRLYNMKQVDESDGQKFSDGTLTWRSKGEDGSLESQSKAGERKNLATGCHLQAAGISSSPTPATAKPKSPK